MRGATRNVLLICVSSRNFNPRAPCGARLNAGDLGDVPEEISIHAPHAGRDVTDAGQNRKPSEFQSTRPMRGATLRHAEVSAVWSISIHAPHAGRDLVAQQLRAHAVISIHAPHAGRDN